MPRNVSPSHATDESSERAKNRGQTARADHDKAHDAKNEDLAARQSEHVEIVARRPARRDRRGSPPLWTVSDLAGTPLGVVKALSWFEARAAAMVRFQRGRGELDVRPAKTISNERRTG